MACNGARLNALQEQCRAEELKKLETELRMGNVTVKRTGTKVEFVGWETARTGPGHWHDDCAYHELVNQGSTALRMAMGAAQTQTADRTQTTGR